jgi:ABC-type phosphate transport system permease subunit
VLFRSTSSLFYLALILLVFSLVVNVLAQVIVRRVARRQGLLVR